METVCLLECRFLCRRQVEFFIDGLTFLKMCYMRVYWSVHILVFNIINIIIIIIILYFRIHCLGLIIELWKMMIRSCI